MSCCPPRVILVPAAAAAPYDNHGRDDDEDDEDDEDGDKVPRPGLLCSHLRGDSGWKTLIRPHKINQ